MPRRSGLLDDRIIGTDRDRQHVRYTEKVSRRGIGQYTEFNLKAGSARGPLAGAVSMGFFKWLFGGSSEPQAGRADVRRVAEDFVRLLRKERLTSIDALRISVGATFSPHPGERIEVFTTSLNRESPAWGVRCAARDGTDMMLMLVQPGQYVKLILTAECELAGYQVFSRTIDGFVQDRAFPGDAFEPVLAELERLAERSESADLDAVRNEVYVDVFRHAEPEGAVREWTVQMNSRSVRVRVYRRLIQDVPYFTYVTSGLSDESMQSAGMAANGIPGIRLEYLLYSKEIREEHVALLKCAADFRHVLPGSLFTFTDDGRNPLREGPLLSYVLLWPSLPVFPDMTLQGLLRIKGEAVWTLALVPLFEEEARQYWSEKEEYIRRVRERHPEFWILDEHRQAFGVV